MIIITELYINFSTSKNDHNLTLKLYVLEKFPQNQPFSLRKRVTTSQPQVRGNYLESTNLRAAVIAQPSTETLRSDRPKLTFRVQQSYSLFFNLIRGTLRINISAFKQIIKWPSDYEKYEELLSPPQPIKLVRNWPLTSYAKKLPENQHSILRENQTSSLTSKPREESPRMSNPDPNLLLIWPSIYWASENSSPHLLRKPFDFILEWLHGCIS